MECGFGITKCNTMHKHNIKQKLPSLNFQIFVHEFSGSEESSIDDGTFKEKVKCMNLQLVCNIEAACEIGLV